MDIKKQSTIFILNFTTKFNTEEKLKTGFERFGKQCKQTFWLISYRIS